MNYLTKTSKAFEKYLTIGLTKHIIPVGDEEYKSIVRLNDNCLDDKKSLYIVDSTVTL